jgi:class 3 adenylate cyclase/predicted ATPase
MECPTCKAEIPERSKFCTECGASLPVACPSCGEGNAPRAKYCANCGNKLTIGASTAPAEAASPLPAPAPPMSPGERRQLTLMFCDLVDSTALAARLDPEDMRDVISAYQDCCAGMIARFEGHIARFMGDGVLAYFGYPIAHEDGAERAVRAALGLVPAIAKLPLRHDVSLQIRIGIATGMVVVGDLACNGAFFEEVVGQTPALAARLQTIAAPNQVLISSPTHRLIGGLFDCVDAGHLNLKGFAQPVQAWRVIGEGYAEGRFEAMHQSALTGMVGREREIDLLVDRWILAASHEGQVVLLSGEPGIGKSRITQEFQQRIAGQPHRRLHHSCSPHHQNSAFFPIISQLEHAAGFNRDDPPEAKIDKLESLLLDVAADVSDAVPLFAALLGLAPSDRCPALERGAEQQKARTLAALMAQLEARSARQPVLVIFEDVQWIDPTTSEFLGLVIDRIQNLPVLLIITHRADFTPPWTGYAHITTLSLNRLSQAQSAAIVERITGGKPIPPEVHEQIVAKTDGIPLFVEELTKAVLESGLLVEEGARYVLCGPLLPLAIPATLHDSLMARLDHLSPVKEVAQMAAAIGREFTYELLAAISPMQEAELRKALALLISSGLVFARGMPPTAVYAFKHALVQDIAYETSLRTTRQQLHARIARTLEEKFPETALNRPELVAHHYALAGMASEGSLYLYRAGQLAAARSANIEAVNHLRKGLELLSALPETPDRRRQELDLQVALGARLIALKGFAAEETVGAYRRAQELSQQIGNIATMFPALYGEWLYHTARAEHRTAKGIAMRFLELASGHQDGAPNVMAHRVAGVTHLCLAEYDPSRTHLQSVLSQYDPAAHGELALRYGTDPAVSSASFLSWVLWLQGAPREAIEMRAQGIARARELNHSHTLAHALCLGGCLLDCMRGAETSARDFAEAVITLAREHRFPYWLAAGTAARGWCLMKRGRADEAVSVLLDAVAQADAAVMEEFRPFLLSMLAEAHGRSGRPDLGCKALDEALARVNSTEERWVEPELYRLRGDLALLGADREVAAAEACFRQAIGLARRQGARAWELRAAVSLGMLWRDQGRRGEALDVLAPVYGWFTEGFDTPDQNAAKVLLDELRD